MPESKFSADKIQIVDFKIIKGQIESPFEFDMSTIKGHTFNVEFHMGFSLQESLVKADFKVFVETNSTVSIPEEAKGSFHFVYIFHVDNLEDLASYNSEDILDVDGSLSNAIAAITHSTSRGILMTRFQGTALEGFIMPVIDPNELLKG